MEVGAATDVGLQRSRNEDALLVDEDARVFAVADGLGGHPAGDVASGIAVDTLHRALDRSSQDREEAPDRLLSAALREAHEAVVQGAADDPSRSGMGTTVVVTMLADGGHEAWVAHVGDSRAYLFRRSDLHQVTSDHTTGGLLRTGTISQALGTSGGIDPDVVRLDLEPGDRLLLCSDGLTDMVDVDTIGGIVADDAPPQEVCHRLVDVAKERGGHDNISVIVVDAD